MPSTLQMLKQVRSAVATVTQTASNPEHRALLSAVELYLNELMLQEAPAFYLDFLKTGRALVMEGRDLTQKLGASLNAFPTLRDDLTEESRIEAINAAIAVLHDCLLEITKILDEGRSMAEANYLSRVTTWESSLYIHRLEKSTNAQEPKAKQITREAVKSYLEKKFPEWSGLRVTKFVTLDGGISKKTILFETEDAINGTQAMVLRAEQPVNLLFFDGNDVAQEFYMILLMYKAGMPVPEPLWLEEDSSHLGYRFLVSRKAEGKTFGGSLGSSQTPPDELHESIMSTLFQMHDIKLEPSDPLVQKSNLSAWVGHKTIRDTAKYCATEFVPALIRRAGIKITPQIMRCLRWLEKNVPDCDEPPVVVHYDFAYNNILVHNNRVTAVLDWETSFIGDPANDILWTQPNLGGHSMPEFLKIYKERTGRDVTPYRLAYSQIVKCAINNIAGQTALQAIDRDDNAPLHMGVMAFKYMPLFATNLDELIAAAEKAKGR